MTWYDFMTLVWSVLWGVSAGAVVTVVAAHNRGGIDATAVGIGAAATVGMLLTVWVIREARR